MSKSIKIGVYAQFVRNLHEVDRLELNFPCHRSAAFASNSMSYKTQHGQPKHIQYFKHLHCHVWWPQSSADNDCFCWFLKTFLFSHYYQTLHIRDVYENALYKTIHYITWLWCNDHLKTNANNNNKLEVIMHN